jgi:hypothetical protein
MNGDQGILNYVLNQKASMEGLRVERHLIMRWPGHSMDGLSLDRIIQRRASALIIHWAGMKSTLLRNMVGADILLYFEKFYYSRVPRGAVRRVLATCQDVSTKARRSLGLRIKILLRAWTSRPWKLVGSEKPPLSI